MKHLIWILIVTISLAACIKQSTLQDSQYYIRGRLFLTDTITQNLIGMPLSNKKVSVSDNPNDSLNFIYQIKTDSSGYFVFNLLSQKAGNYVVRFSDSIGSYLYSGKTIVDKDSNNIVVNVSLDMVAQNGFVVYLKDSLGGYIPNATVLLYNSEVLANINDPSGAMQTLYSDSHGRIFKINLPIADYFLNASKQSGSISLIRLNKKIPISSESGIIRDTMILK